MTTYDTIIAGGMVVDGTRAQRLRADVGIKDGKIAKIGRLRAADADEVLDADGMIVAPGHIDLHTHYDAQLFWDPYCTLSGWHGVTSIVIGNCGFGFAPVAPEDRDRAMLTMTRTEAIPFDAMAAGMPWDWVTYPEFLDAVDRTPKAVNMRSFFPLNPALNWVLGYERAKAGEMPTDEEHAQLRALLHEAMDAGAGGWSVQRLRASNVQRDHDGNPMNTDVMPNETLFELAEVLAERNQGFIQATFAPDPADETHTEHRRTYERLADISGRPVLFNVITPNAQRPEQHLKQIAWVEECRLKGLPIYGQAVTTDVGLAFTFEEWNLWDDMDAWREATLGTVEERMAKLADPARRPALRESESLAVTCPIADIVLLETSSPQYQRYAETRVGDIAADLGVHPVDAMLDIAVADNLAATFYASGTFNDPAHLVDLLELPVGTARRVRRRRPHPLPHRRPVAHRAAHKRGPRPRDHLPGRRPLAHGRTPRPVRRFHRPGNPLSRQSRRRDRLRPRQPGHRRQREGPRHARRRMAPRPTSLRLPLRPGQRRNHHPRRQRNRHLPRPPPPRAVSPAPMTATD